MASKCNVSGIDLGPEMRSTPSDPPWSCYSSPSFAVKDVLFLLPAFLHASTGKYEWLLAAPLFLRRSILTVYTILHPIFSHWSLNLGSLKRVSVPTNPTTFATVRSEPGSYI